MATVDDLAWLRGLVACRFRQPMLRGTKLAGAAVVVGAVSGDAAQGGELASIRLSHEPQNGT